MTHLVRSTAGLVPKTYFLLTTLCVIRILELMKIFILSKPRVFGMQSKMPLENLDKSQPKDNHKPAEETP
jgi:hypothetical protein